MGTFPVLPLTVFTFLNLFNFAKVSSYVTDFNANILTGKHLHQGYRYHKFRKTFFKILSPTLLIGFNIQGRIKICLAAGPSGIRILW